MKLRNNLLKGLMVLTCTALTTLASSAFDGRIAVSSDGNQHDPDDYGATAATLAILAKAGLQDKLVHYDYNSHIGTGKYETVAAREAIMTESALGGQSRWKFKRSVFFDDIKDLQGSINNIKKVVNESSVSDPLYFILGGPPEVLWRGLNAAEPAKRKFVTVISHSGWNDWHANDAGVANGNAPHTELKHTIVDVKALGINYKKITNQNNYFNTRDDWSRLYWMRDHSDANVRWLYTRIQKVGIADFSDSGMAWYLVTGKDTSPVEELKTFIGTGIPVPTDNAAPIGSVISLKSVGNGKYICADKGLDGVNLRLYANRTSAGGWEKFTVTDAGNGYVSFIANANGKYIRTDGSLDAVHWSVAANLASTNPGDWTKFTWIANNDGTISLKAKGNGKYVRADGSLDSKQWPITANLTTTPASWAKFIWKVEK